MSRLLTDLVAEMEAKAEMLLQDCKAQGVELLVTCTRRTLEEQAALYAQGRTTPGKIVTRAKPGQSAHNYGCAIDIVPLVNGKPLWQFNAKNPGPIWSTIGRIGQGLGLTWYGSPLAPFVEGCHLELPDWRKHLPI